MKKLQGKEFWRRMVARATQHCERTWRHWTVRLEKLEVVHFITQAFILCFLSMDLPLFLLLLLLNAKQNRTLDQKNKINGQKVLSRSEDKLKDYSK